MKQYDQIHETAVKEVIDAVETIGNMVSSGKSSMSTIINNRKDPNNYNFSSIAKGSSDMTLVFPVMCSRSNTVPVGSMVSKSIERKCVLMLQIIFSAYQISNAKSASEFIHQFHTNLDGRMASFEDVFEILNNSADVAGVTVDRARLNAIKEDMIRNTNHYLPDSINESSLNDYSIRNGAGRIHIVKEANYSKTYTDPKDNQMTKDVKDITEKINKQILNTDIKKANELAPTTMVVNYMFAGDDGKITNVGNAVIGVKAKLYFVDSADIVNHIVSKTNDNNWIVQFIRGTTREISFWKDFIFAIDKAKIDALSMSNKNSTTSKMWKVLERRSAGSKLRRTVGNGAGGVSAITSLIISQEEVELMKRVHSIDIERLTIARNILDKYNLLCICIADESLEVAKFLFDDNESNWENVSFTHLEREASDNAYKKVVNMMTKTAR